MCSDVTILDSYNVRTKVEKLAFWDEDISLCSLKKQHFKQLAAFIQQTIANTQESAYTRCKAIDFSIKITTEIYVHNEIDSLRYGLRVINGGKAFKEQMLSSVVKG